MWYTLSRVVNAVHASHSDEESKNEKAHKETGKAQPNNAQGNLSENGSPHQQLGFLQGWDGDRALQQLAS